MTGCRTKQTGAPRWSALQLWTLGVTSMAAFMAGMDALVVTTALPTIHADLGAATSALSWTVAAYAPGFAAVVLAGVAVGDRYGRRVFLTGVALFTLGSAGCALSPNVGLLIAVRAIQGVGGGLAVPLSLVLISEVFPPPAAGPGHRDLGGDHRHGGRCRPAGRRSHRVRPRLAVDLLGQRAHRRRRTRLRPHPPGPQPEGVGTYRPRRHAPSGRLQSVPSPMPSRKAPPPAGRRRRCSPQASAVWS